jgi:hypothetical protein
MTAARQAWCAVILAAWAAPVGAERIRDACLDSTGNVRIATGLGPHRQVTRHGLAFGLTISPDRGSAAWLIGDPAAQDVGSAHTSNELALFREGRVTSLVCRPVIRNYWFWRGGREIAIDCGGMHFAGYSILYDVRTRTQLASFDQGEVPLAQRPDWANGDGESQTTGATCSPP